MKPSQDKIEEAIDLANLLNESVWVYSDGQMAAAESPFFHELTDAGLTVEFVAKPGMDANPFQKRRLGSLRKRSDESR